MKGKITNVVESFLQDLEDGEAEMIEITNIIGPNELKELLILAKKGESVCEK